MIKALYSTRYIRPSIYREFDYEINTYTKKRAIVPKKLSDIKLNNKSVVIGTIYDPYNEYEEQYELTRACLKFLMKINCKITIMTNSSLILRDIELLKNLRHTPLICVKISTLNEHFHSKLEKGIKPINERLELLKTLHTQGLKTICYIKPIYPFITEPLNIINKVNDYTNSIWLENYRTSILNKHFKYLMTYIKRNYPALKTVYNMTFYEHKDDYWIETWNMIKTYCTKEGIINKIHNRIKYSVPIYFR